MKIRQNLLVSHKENYNTTGKHISRNSLPMSAIKSQKVPIELNKKREPIDNSTNKQNIPSIKPQQHQEQNRKTIENTIKDLLKGKEDLYNYLESQKQFISILDNHDTNLKYLTKQKGKLTSSLTEKKKSRIESHHGNKSRLNSNSKKLDQYFIQIDKNSNKKIKNSSVTVQLVNYHEQIKITSEPCQIQTKHYETISFDNIKNEISLKSSQKVFKNTQKQENQNPKYCLVLTSPQKKKHKKVILKNYNIEQNVYSSKYGEPNFSPWAFPKDNKQNDFDWIEMNSPRSQSDKNQGFSFHKKYTQENEIKNNPKICVDNNNQKNKKMQFLSRSINAKRKMSTDSQNKQLTQKNQYISSFNWTDEKKKQENQIKFLDKQKMKQKIQQLNLKETQFKQKTINKKIKKNNQNKKQYNVNIVKSSQVIILNSQPGKVSEMFAPKSSLKHHMHHKRSLNKDFSFVNNERKRFHTEIDEDSFQKINIQSQQTDNQIIQENELAELKKTEEFLKQIIISKNNVPCFNNNILRTKSKKQFVKLNTVSDQRNENKIKSISAKQSAQMRFKTYNHLKSQCVFMDTVINFKQQKGQKAFLKQDFTDKKCESDKENLGSCSQQVYYKKAKTSLDNPLHENQVYQLISNSNTKYLTEASLSGFYMINDSKIRNEKCTFVRKKRHSAMLIKNRKNSGSAQNKNEGQKKRYSFSVQKEVLNRSEMSMLQQGKGFGIVNPLTKQLYKKYVSILQKKN